MKDFVRELRIREAIKVRKDKKGFQMYYLIQVRIFIFWITIRRTMNIEGAEEITTRLNTYF